MPNATLRPACLDDESGIDAVIRAAFGADEVAHGDQVGDLWVDVRHGHILHEARRARV